jgi:serine/threonine-protein kinase
MSDVSDLESILPPGTVLCGKYEIVRMLGRGGMGVVAQARHLRMDRDVALKILLPAFREQPEVVARFEREARAASQLANPHVTRVLDVDTLPDGSPFMVMELLRGRDLGQILAAQGKLPYRAAVGYVLEACAGMVDAHRAGIVHRDLKPNNLFIDTQGARPVLKILDFGISKILGDVNASMTQTSTTFGTPLYMSPEQVRSMKHVDGRTDIWSLGVVLYELLAGEPPFQAPSATAILAAIIADDPVPISTHRPDLPPALADAVMRALQKNVNARFRDVESFAAAIAPFGPGDGVASPASLSAIDASAGASGVGLTSEQGVALRTAERPEAPPTTSQAGAGGARPFASIAIGMGIAVVLGTVLLVTALKKRPSTAAIAETAVKPAPSVIAPSSAPVVAPAETAPLASATATATATATAAIPAPPKTAAPVAAPTAAPAATPSVKPTVAPAITPPPAPRPPPTTDDPPRYL